VLWAFNLQLELGRRTPIELDWYALFSANSPQGTIMNRPITALLALVLAISLHSPVAFAEVDIAAQLATINKIIRGEGKPGETATAKNGEVIYTVLEGGIVEIRNLRYNTVQRFSTIKPNDNNRSK
jgi:hypothetical protein